MERKIHLVTVKQLANLERFEWLSESAIRHLIFEAEPKVSAHGKTVSGNGLAEAGAIVRIGRRVLVDVGAFESWLVSHRVGATDA